MEALTVPKDKLAAHYHNTYDRAIENLLISLYYGVSVIDSSIAGLGGCPYAQGASGNVATEDVVFMCQILGLETGINLKDIMTLGNYLINDLGYAKRSSVDFDDLNNFEYFQKMLI